MIYVLIVSKNGHFLNPPTQSYAYVIYEWSLHSYSYDDLLVIFFSFLTPTESLGRKCRIQESNLSLSHTTSSSCVTWSWPESDFRSTHCLGWAIGMWKIDMHSTFTTLLWSQNWRIGKHFHSTPGPPHLAWADFKIKVKQIAYSTMHFDQWNPLISKM